MRKVVAVLLIDGLMTWGDEDVQPEIAEDNAYLFE
jgi:hypothetical protein